MNGRDNLTT